METRPFNRISDKRLAAGLLLKVKSQNPVLLQMIELEVWENLNVGLLVTGLRPQSDFDEFFQIICQTGHAAALLCATDVVDQVAFMDTFDAACRKMETTLEQAKVYDHGIDRQRTQDIISGLRSVILDFINPDYINPLRARVDELKLAV